VRGRELAFQLADELRIYAMRQRPGSHRLKYIVYQDRICSGTYKDQFWTWRGKGYGHWAHIHVSFTAAAETDGLMFPIPILLERSR
jgi:hypothetical protein